MADAASRIANVFVMMISPWSGYGTALASCEPVWH
jgi:hypothetical protein